MIWPFDLRETEAETSEVAEVPPRPSEPRARTWNLLGTMPGTQPRPAEGHPTPRKLARSSPSAAISFHYLDFEVGGGSLWCSSPDALSLELKSSKPAFLTLKLFGGNEYGWMVVSHEYGGAGGGAWRMDLYLTLTAGNLSPA